MAKSSGLGDNLYIDGFDLSGDVGSLGRIGGSQTTQDVTGINKSAMERIGLLRDGGIDFNAFWNPGAAATSAHNVLKTLPTTDRVVTYLRGTALGGEAACMVGKQLDYAGTRGNEGSLTFAVQAQASGYGLEWGRQGTAGWRTDGAAANGPALDDGAATTFGMQAYLQVAAVTGTSVTVKIQSSSDGGVGDAWADVPGAAFTAATGRGAQRIVVPGTIERYLRVVSAGTFTSAQFSVVICRNPVAVAF